MQERIAFGGGCHWCTEAVFLALEGVDAVDQGYVASTGDLSDFSEAVIVNFNSEKVNLNGLIQIHLMTHHSTKNHSMRADYRSAIYVFSEKQRVLVEAELEAAKTVLQLQAITEVLDFREFKPSREAIQNYYFKNPSKPFCKRYIDPKLKMLLRAYPNYVNTETIKHLV